MIIHLLHRETARTIEELASLEHVTTFQVERMIYTAIIEDKKAIVIDENDKVFLSDSPEEIRKAAERLKHKAEQTKVKLARDNLFKVAETLMQISREMTN